MKLGAAVAAALVAAGSASPGCKEQSPCVSTRGHVPDGHKCPDGTGTCACDTCVGNDLWGPCVEEPDASQKDRWNFGFRSPEFDTLYAMQAKDGTVTVDGDLRDWADVPASRRYTDLPFATADGQVVVFEKRDDEDSDHAWCGPDDFSISAMIKWDADHLFLALDVTDETHFEGHNGGCYKQGVQVAFEVGGADSKGQDGGSLTGVLQAKRSDDTAVSRVHLLNVGLNGSQKSCSCASCKGGDSAETDCCVHYERNGGEQEWAYKLDAAVTRTAPHTYYELAFSKYDLLGADYAKLNEWRGGLRFGFSFLVNDGDTGASQQGWAGYYPHAIVSGKDPAKLGTVVLDAVVPASSHASAVAFSELGTADQGCSWLSSGDVLDDYMAVLKGYTRLRCLESCAASPTCHGFEFSGASKVCALWNRTPQATAQKSGATCYVKLVTGPEATAELQNGQGGSSSAITSILLMALGFGLGVGLILVAQYFALQRARTADSSNFRQQHSQSLLMGNIGSAEGGGDAADGPPASPPDGSQGDVQLEGGRDA